MNFSYLDQKHRNHRPFCPAVYSVDLVVRVVGGVVFCSIAHDNLAMWEVLVLAFCF